MASDVSVRDVIKRTACTAMFQCSAVSRAADVSMALRPLYG